MDRNFLDSYLPLLGGGVGGEPNFNKRQLTNQMVSHGPTLFTSCTFSLLLLYKAPACPTPTPLPHFLFEMISLLGTK